MPEHQQIQQSKKTNTIFQKQATPIVQTPVSNPYSIIQRAKVNPRSLTRADIMQLQRTIGNQAVGRLLSSIGSSSTAQQATVQRQEIPEEEEPLQGKTTETVQRQEIPEEEEPLQGKMVGAIQRQEIPEEEVPLQGKMIGTVQRQEIPEEEKPLQTKKENNTGMPDNLKAGVESLSGIDMSNVRVHYNSDKPAEVGALAYTQGTNIHVAPGQERHLPHEAWHVVQQAQGRVKPTMQMKDVAVNDNVGLEQEADIMGSKAVENQKSNVMYERNQQIVTYGTQKKVFNRDLNPVIQKMEKNEYLVLCDKYGEVAVKKVLESVLKKEYKDVSVKEFEITMHPNRIYPETDELLLKYIAYKVLEKIDTTHHNLNQKSPFINTVVAVIRGVNKEDKEPEFFVSFSLGNFIKYYEKSDSGILESLQEEIAVYCASNHYRYVSGRGHAEQNIIHSPLGLSTKI